MLSSAVVVALAAVLLVLAILQYRWSGEVSEAASSRMRANLQASMMGFRQDLYRELAAVCAAFRPEFGDPTRNLRIRYAQQYEAWSRTAGHTGLVKNLYLLEGAGGTHQQFVRFNPETKQFESVDPPAEFSRLLQRLAADSSDPQGIVRRFNPSGDRPPHNGPQAPLEARRLPGGPWAFEQTALALVHPTVQHHERRHNGARQGSMSWLIIQLDRNILEEQFHDLSERYFAGRDGLEYQVAVLGGNDPNQVVYSSAAEFGQNARAGADAVLELFGGPPGPPFPGPVPHEGPGGAPAPGTPGRYLFGSIGFPRMEAIRYSGQERDWQLVVKHRKGSLDSVVAATRRRDLAVSFAILLVLGATMAMILIASQRARRFARLQMEFVTGVSHELRTPLAVINSAADNISDGVVDNRQQLMRYGTVIKKQARQLSNLVEQILLFAATRQNSVQYSLRPIPVQELIGAALNDTSELLRGAGFEVEQTIAPGLPWVMGDLAALSQCLQNLITNAVKYGGQDRWIGVRASAAEGKEGKQVLIAIEDHGRGIEHGDLQRIFEPFYRSPAVRAAQVHGSGLGLTLAKSIAEAMGGALRATSERGKGSSFILSLHAAEMAATADGAPPAMSAASSSDQKS